MSVFDDIVKQKKKDWNAPGLMDGAKASRGSKLPFSSPLMNFATYGGIPRDKITEFCGNPGGGKAQPLYSKVLTPTGWVLMGDIKVGDKVFDGYGNVCVVDGVFPQGERPVYEITLQDNTSFRVADNHLNSVWWYDSVHRKRVDAVLTTEELVEKKNYLETNGGEKVPIRIDIPKVNWPYRSVLIDPYLLGALIGDGSLVGDFSFVNGEKDVVEKVDKILRRDWDCKLKQSKSDPFHWEIQCINKWYPLTIKYHNLTFKTVSEFQTWLANNGYKKFDYVTIRKLANNEPCYTSRSHPELLDIEIINNEPSGRAKLIDALNTYELLCKSINKHIPEDYLYNSEEVRIELVRGLFDTDGYSRYIPKQEIACDWSTSSPQLSNDCEFLFRSLGIRTTVTQRRGLYTDKNGIKHEGQISYTHYLHVPKGLKIFSSKKHSKQYHERQNQPIRNIKSIKYIGVEECACIHVTSPNHTYITDNLTLTHNTSTAVDLCKNSLSIFKSEWEERCINLRENGTTKEEKFELAELEASGPRKVLYIDLEHSFDMQWAETLGIVDTEIDVMQPPDVPAEEILQMIQEMIESNEIGLIVLDSIPSLVPRAELEKKYGERTVASLAGLMTVFCRKIVPLLSRYHTTLLMINQIRDNMENPYIVQTPGGQAIKFYSSLRMLFSLGNPIDILGNELPQKTEDPAGYLIKVRLLKQKSAPNDRKNASYFLLSQSGIKPEMDYAQLAIKKYGIIKKSGAWFSLADPNTGELLEEDEKIVKINGLPKVYEYLETHPEYFETLKRYIENDINGIIDG